MSQPEVAKMQASMIVWIGKEEKANDEIKDIVEKIATKLIILEPHNIDLSIAKARKNTNYMLKKRKKGTTAQSNRAAPHNNWAYRKQFY